MRRNNRELGMMRLTVFTGLLCASVLLTGKQAMATEPSATVVSDTTATTQENADAEKTTGKIITKKGQKYYEYADGSLAKNEFVKIKKKTYYFGKNGVMQTGWMEKGEKYYYFDRSSGVRKTGCNVDGIKINKNGDVNKSSYNKEKIKTMIEARTIMDKVTKPTDSKSQKLKKVFDWVLKHPYKRYHILAKTKSETGWEMIYANDIFEKGNGCCVSESSALAFLAKECGYKDVYLCDDTGHAWVEIDGKVYDPLFAEAKNYNNYYNSTYEKAKLHRVGKKKI